jgi:aldehyde dehydrogenase (NAD+)
VQEGIYDEFLAQFTERVKKITVGDPFQEDIAQGPQVSQTQFDVSQRLIATVYRADEFSVAYHGIHRLWQGGRS